MRQQKEKEPAVTETRDSEKKYVYAIVAIILITGLVVVLLNNGRVTDVENLDARLAKIYDAAPSHSIQKIFEKKEKSQYGEGSVEYEAGR